MLPLYSWLVDLNYCCCCFHSQITYRNRHQGRKDQLRTIILVWKTGSQQYNHQLELLHHHHQVLDPEKSHNVPCRQLCLFERLRPQTYRAWVVADEVINLWRNIDMSADIRTEYQVTWNKWLKYDHPLIILRLDICLINDSPSNNQQTLHDRRIGRPTHWNR